LVGKVSKPSPTFWINYFGVSNTSIVHVLVGNQKPLYVTQSNNHLHCHFPPTPHTQFSQNPSHCIHQQKNTKKTSFQRERPFTEQDPGTECRAQGVGVGL